MTLSSFGAYTLPPKMPAKLRLAYIPGRLMVIRLGVSMTHVFSCPTLDQRGSAVGCHAVRAWRDVYGKLAAVSGSGLRVRGRERHHPARSEDPHLPVDHPDTGSLRARRQRLDALVDELIVRGSRIG